MATPSKRKSKPAPPAPAIVMPPGAPSTATCGRCQDQFQLTQNHATACFGHLADDPNHDIDCDRVFKVGYEGSVYKMGCCGKLFPSNSCDTPDLSAEWSPDLAGIFEEEGEQIFRGLCQKSLNAGIGGAPHVFKDCQDLGCCWNGTPTSNPLALALAPLREGGWGVGCDDNNCDL